MITPAAKNWLVQIFARHVNQVMRPDRVRRSDDKTSDPQHLLKYAAKMRCLAFGGTDLKEDSYVLAHFFLS